VDPEVTLAEWRRALLDSAYYESEESFVELAAQELRGWIRLGGFEPSWTETERAAIVGPRRA